MYILLMRSTTILSRIIHLLTGAEFTHVAIGVSPDTMYTMTRMDMRFVFPAGLQLEHPWANKYHVMFRLDAPIPALDRARDILLFMYSHREDYKYNVLGLLLNILHIGHERHNKMFCSEFCSKVLRASGVYAFDKPDYCVRPMDFLQIPGIQRSC